MAPPDEPAPSPPPEPHDELPATPLAGLVTQAKEKFADKPDRHGPAAVKALAAVVRDLKGMPELSVAREGSTRLRLSRKGRVGFVVVEFDAAILTMHLSTGGFVDEKRPGDAKTEKFGLHGDTWVSMDGGADLFAELRTLVLKLYPELA